MLPPDPPGPLGKWEKQGGGDTLGYWNYVFDDALSDAVAKWRDPGWGTNLQDGLPSKSHAVWADDMFFFAMDFESFTSMAQDVCFALNEKGLSLKPESFFHG